MDINQITQELDALFAQEKIGEIPQFLESHIAQAAKEGAQDVLLTLYNEIIGFYRETGQYTLSIENCHKAVALMNEMGIQDTIPYATTLLNIANAHRAAGLLQESLDLYNRVRPIYVTHLDEDDMYFANFYNNLSLLYQEMGDFASAKDQLVNALSIVSHKPDRQFEAAVTQANLANTCIELGQDDEARARAEEAIRIFEELGVDDAHYSAALSALGSLYYMDKDYNSALNAMEKSRECVAKYLGTDNIQYQRLSENIVIIQDKIKNSEKLSDTERTDAEEPSAVSDGANAERTNAEEPSAVPDAGTVGQEVTGELPVQMPELEYLPEESALDTLVVESAEMEILAGALSEEPAPEVAVTGEESAPEESVPEASEEAPDMFESEPKVFGEDPDKCEPVKEESEPEKSAQAAFEEAPAISEPVKEESKSEVTEEEPVSSEPAQGTSEEEPAISESESKVIEEEPDKYEPVKEEPKSEVTEEEPASSDPAPGASEEEPDKYEPVKEEPKSEVTEEEPASSDPAPGASEEEPAISESELVTNEKRFESEEIVQEASAISESVKEEPKPEVIEEGSSSSEPAPGASEEEPAISESVKEEPKPEVTEEEPVSEEPAQRASEEEPVISEPMKEESKPEVTEEEPAISEPVKEELEPEESVATEKEPELKVFEEAPEEPELEDLTPPIIGMELCRRYYEEYGRPMIAGKFHAYESRIAVGLVGKGSDCFGFDDVLSQDHDFGPRFVMWVTKKVYDEIGEELQEAYDKLPNQFLGVDRIETFHGKDRSGVMIIEEFYKNLLGFDLVGMLAHNHEDTASGKESLDTIKCWLSVQEYGLAAAVNGEVFRDDEGIFTQYRKLLSAYYPKAVWYRKVAQTCALFSQSGQYNLPRMRRRGQLVSAELAKAECVKQAMKLYYLLNRKYAPHDKWLYKGMPENPQMTLGEEGMENADVPKLVEQMSLLPADIAHEAALTTAVESLAVIFANELEKLNMVGKCDLYLDACTKELMTKSDALLTAIVANTPIVTALSLSIAKSEFEAFDKVQNEGGRASCQNNWPTFKVMRMSQYMTWTEDMLLQYLYEFKTNYANGRNMIEEKYARMMESTAPLEYARFANRLPEVSEAKKAIVEQIVALQVKWMEEFAAQYPNLAEDARTIHTAEDLPYDTSYETYLRGELRTYSDRMLEMYGRYIVAHAQEGKNVAREIMENTVQFYGYQDLASANAKSMQS
jgi:tetratricopeptide (TPR) repeat protein